MGTCLQQEWNVSAWQAVNFVFWKLFQEKLMLATNRTEKPEIPPPKELTKEAFSMIVVMTAFVLFAVLGSLSTAIEFFCKENAEKPKVIKNTYSRNFKNNLYMKDWLNKIRSFLHCFCFIKNGKKLFLAHPNKKQFECLHGIRVISNLSILLHHIGLYYIYTRRSVELKPLLENPISKPFLSAYFGVDAFFVLSGFLNAYFFSTTYDKRNGKTWWFNFYMKRFIRITPAYMIVLGFYTTLLSYTGSGPIWPEYATNPVCKENWWRYLFYINNFELSEKSCMLWCWHLAAEMQFYIVSPIFLLSILRWKRFGYSLTSVTIFLTGLYSFLITKRCNLLYSSLIQLDFYDGDLLVFMDRARMYLDKLYCKPCTRISSYLIGVLLGNYFCDKNFKSSKNKWITLCIGWTATGILIWISLFSLVKRKESLFETALYNSVKHIFFSVGISWIIFVCLTRQGGFINDFLSSKLFLPFSKLSYFAYLIHMLILQRDYQAAQELEGVSLLQLVLYVFRVYFWTFVFSIPGSLLFEMPMINLFDLHMKKSADYKKRKE